MAKALSEAGFLENIGFLITYKCQIACPHCVIGAGPNRKEEMLDAEAQGWIRQAASYRGGQIRTACFTGGEPFYDVEKLRQLALVAAAQGLLPTVVTNAFWATSRETALATLGSIPVLRVIAVSTDSHHLAQIPYDRVENALWAAKKLGLMCNVSVCTEDEKDPAHQRLVERLERIIDREQINSVITFPAGRALKYIDPARYSMTDQRPATACISAHTPVVFPDGRVFACIGPVIDLHTRHPLLLGNLKATPLEHILDNAEMNPVLHILRVWGPATLCEMLEAKGVGDRLPRRFVRNSVCSLCYALMADAGLCIALKDIAQDRELGQKTAYARQYFLKESRMLETMRVAGALDP
jgi:MoaA/NifB/PqqE/SkfB family radical SAM enzyme